MQIPQHFQTAQTAPYVEVEDLIININDFNKGKSGQANSTQMHEDTLVGIKWLADQEPSEKKLKQKREICFVYWDA